MKLVTKDIYWMNKGIILAQNAQTKGEIPIGALLVYNNNLISESWNQPIINCDPSAHAEILALRAGGKYFKNYRLTNTTLYVTLEPCLMCIGAIIHARISRLVYGASNSKKSIRNLSINILNNVNINHHTHVSGGILANECSLLLKNFFYQRRIKKVIKTI